MSIQIRRAVTCVLVITILVVHLSTHFSHFLCPVHSHHSQDTAEAHLKAGASHCLCFFMSFFSPRFDPVLSFERAFGLTPLPADGRPLALEGLKIFHPPLSA